MRCAACNGGIPPGKVLFCPPCFVVLPNKDQRAMVSHYHRVCNVEKKPVSSEHIGIKAMVDRLAKKIREIRKLDAPSPAVVVCGMDLASADSVQIVRLAPKFSTMTLGGNPL